ncbi:SRPBCC family protein [Micromonospora sp. FIMYZ51]|uniref:SRPBCC family protein n=1 Tax=Micromonospora sp. FIMYZ51 TaxID=3051832 RepID=UPI00311FF1CA
MIDATSQISAVRRQVGARTLAAGEARVMTISQSYDASVADVWDACTNPERLPRWFAPVSGELRLHGRYQVEGNASGTVERCDPPKSFAATWEFGDEISWIELRLDPTDDGRTRLLLEHVGHVKDEFWLQFGPGATGVGWDLALLGLATHLAGTGDAPPEQNAAWMGSAAGRAFVAASSEGWFEASVAAGTDPDEARAAADRTTAFYTGAPQP